MKEHCCEGLSDLPPIHRGIIDKWMTGRFKTAEKALFEYILSKYEAIPTNPQARAPFTAEMLNELIATKDATNMGVRALLNTHFKDDPKRPEGLDSNTAGNWIHNHHKTINLVHYRYVMSCYDALQSNEPSSSTMQDIHIHF